MSKHLSFGRMLAVAFGDFFGGGAFNIINFLYPGFLALAVGLSPYLAGLVILIARIFDAVIDPLVGFFSDRLRVRFGTRRGSLVVSAPLALLALFLMFFPYSHPDVSVRFFQVLASYIFFCAVHSVVMIPYFSLVSEITDDYTQRARLNSLRLGFSIFSSILCVALPGMIVAQFEGNTGYMVMSLIFGVVFMVCIGITGIFAREGIPAPAHGGGGGAPFRVADFLKPFRVKVFRQYLYMFLCTQLTMAIMSTLFFFYVDFYFCRDLTASGQGSAVGMIGAALMFGMQIVALPFYLAVVKRTSKTVAYIIGSVIWIAAALVLLLLPANSDPVALYLLAAVIGFGISGPGLIPHAILPDVIDVGHLQFGERAAGIFSGASNLVIQIGQALCIALVMALLGMAGFVEQDISEGAAKVVSQVAPAQDAIVLIMAFAPLVFMSLGIAVCARFRLNKARHEQVVAALEEGEQTRKAVLEQL